MKLGDTQGTFHVDGARGDRENGRGSQRDAWESGTASSVQGMFTEHSDEIKEHSGNIPRKRSPR
jgi:hypothetical protein